MQPRSRWSRLIVTNVAPFAWRRVSFTIGSGVLWCRTYSVTVFRARARAPASAGPRAGFYRAPGRHTRPPRPVAGHIAGIGIPVEDAVRRSEVPADEHGKENGISSARLPLAGGQQALQVLDGHARDRVDDLPVLDDSRVVPVVVRQVCVAMMMARSFSGGSRSAGGKVRDGRLGRRAHEDGNDHQVLDGRWRNGS